jgi:carbamoyltransferase
MSFGALIAQTPVHALETLKRSTGMHALFLVADSGDVFVAWHDVTKGAKDSGTMLRAWIDVWRYDAGRSRSDAAIQ